MFTLRRAIVCLFCLFNEAEAAFTVGGGGFHMVLFVPCLQFVLVFIPILLAVFAITGETSWCTGFVRNNVLAVYAGQRLLFCGASACLLLFVQQVHTELFSGKLSGG